MAVVTSQVNIWPKQSLTEHHPLRNLLIILLLSEADDGPSYQHVSTADP